jgi:site-specific recombinase XerD
VVDVARKAARSGALGALRDLAIVETLRATGCRRAELAGLCLGDLDLNAKNALGKGKGSKYRRVYWDGDAWHALCTYLWARQESAQDAPTFCSHGNRANGQALSARHISRIVNALAKQAGVEVTPHYFRHVFATKALDETDNLAVVQDMMGHASPATTRVYARTDEEQRKAVHSAVWE